MKLLSLLLTGASASSLTSDRREFIQWMREHGKQYRHSAEMEERFSVFKEAVKFIKQHNAEHAEGKHTYTVGLNQFADMRNEEFQRLMTNPISEAQIRLNYVCPVDYQPSKTTTYPDSLDYTQSDPVMVTPVKDQGQCGSCWSFATTGTWEGQLCKAGHFDCSTWTGASEQELVDCGGRDNADLSYFYDMGCNGGWGDNGLYTLQKQKGGWATEESYPYVSGKTKTEGTCNPDGKATIDVGHVTTCGTVPASDEEAMKMALYDIGPLSIAINAGRMGFQLYKSGVYNDKRCSKYTLNHAVLAVGYGTEDGQDYFLVKNSWGAPWGAQGYIKMTRDGSNQCGVASHAVYPIIES